MSDNSRTRLISGPKSLAHRRNMWAFYGYTVVLARLEEQAITPALIEAIRHARQKADVLLLAVSGSAPFAEALGELRAVDGLFLTSEHPNWKEECAPDVVVKGAPFADPGELRPSSSLKL
jgi:hypothetical protein